MISRMEVEEAIQTIRQFCDERNCLECEYALTYAEYGEEWHEVKTHVNCALSAVLGSLTKK